MYRVKLSLGVLGAILLIAFSCKKDEFTIFNGLSRAFISSGCIDTSSVYPRVNYNPGSVTRDSITIDTLRTFKLYVPSSYDSTVNYPLVLMFHGSGQNANKMVNNTSWEDEAESEGFIVVYPNAIRYPMATGGSKTKWRTVGTLAQVAPGVVMMDDVLFVKNMIKKVYNTLSIDCNKIYACGFSNGGSFVKTELRIHLDNAFAATASAGGMGAQTVLTPDHGRYMPHFEILGSMDAKKLTICGVTQLPFTSDSLLNSPCIYDYIDSMRVGMMLDTHRLITQVGTPAEDLELLWDNSIVAQDTEYKFRMLKGMTHVFPSDKWNEDYVPIIWEWFSGF